MTGDPFAPLPPAGTTLFTGTAADEAGASVVIPAPLPLPDRERIRHRRLGLPSAVWPYLGRDGAILYATCRFDPPGGKKEVLPYSCTAGGWIWKAPPAPHQLYGLDRLAARPEAPVLLVEGEKAADAARQLFPDYVAMTWQGGTDAVGKADLGPLAGRLVVMWPDNDAPGAKAAAAWAVLARETGVAGFAAVEVPPDWRKPDGKEGWDLADPSPESVSAGDLRAMLDAANQRAVFQITDGRWAERTAGPLPDDRAALHRVGAPAEEKSVPAAGNGAAGGDPSALGAEWPAPDLALAASDALPAPYWPCGLFPGSWSIWIEAAAEGAGAPPDYVGCALLCAAAAQIGNARWGSPWPGWRETTALNVALVGNPSAGKSPALDAVADRITELEDQLNGDWEERLREARTARQAAKEHRALWEGKVKEAVGRHQPPPAEPDGAREPDPPTRRRLRTTDPTVERAAEMSGQNPRGLLLVRDELAGWIANMGRYGGASAAGGDRAFWLQAYGGRAWVPDRKKDGDDGVAVPHLTWSVVGGIQPDRVASLLMSGDDDGLAARFLYTWPAPGTRGGRPQRAADAGALLRALRRLRELPWEPPEPVVLPFTDAAATMMEGWRREVAELEDEASGLLLSWVGKLPGFALRLAVVFEHLAWAAREGAPVPEAVGADAMERATALLACYAVPMARRVFGEAALPEAERDARRLARWLLRQVQCPEVVNARVLRRQTDGPGIPKAERVTAALGELAELGWVRFEAASGSRGGRPRGDWTVSPLVRAAARGVATSPGAP